MSVTENSIFTRVTSRADLQRIFNASVESKAPLMGQSESGGRFSFRPKFLIGASLKGELKATQPIGLVEFVTVLFSINEERYFARTRFESIQGGEAALSIECGVFKLQRRDNFRVAIYQLDGARFEVEVLNELKTKGSLKIIDLSVGGIGAELTLTNVLRLELGDVVQGRLLVPGFLNETIQGDIKYTKPWGSAGSGIKHVGIQFKNTNASIQRELAAKVLEIHREYFSKLEFSKV